MSEPTQTPAPKSAPNLAEDELAAVAGADPVRVESARTIGGLLAAIIGGGVAVFPLVFHLFALAYIALTGGAEDGLTIASYHGDTLGKVHGFLAFQSVFTFGAAIVIVRQRLARWYVGVPILALAGLASAVIGLAVFVGDFPIIVKLGGLGVSAAAVCAGAFVGAAFVLMMRPFSSSRPQNFDK